MQSTSWEEAELRKSFLANDHSPRVAREALSVLAADLPDQLLAIARLLVSELVANSVKHGPSGPSAKVGFYVHVERNQAQFESRSRMAQPAELSHGRPTRRGVTDSNLWNRFRGAGDRVEMAIST